MRLIPCPLANCKRNRLRCRCPIYGGRGKVQGQVDLERGDKNRPTRDLEARVRMLTRFSDGELLKEMAAEEGVSIKRVHDIIYETATELKRLCAENALKQPTGD